MAGAGPAKQPDRLTLNPQRKPKVKAYLKLAGVALAAYAAVNLIQSKVMKVPVIGAYLPGGEA